MTTDNESLVFVLVLTMKKLLIIIIITIMRKMMMTKMIIHPHHDDCGDAFEDNGTTIMEMSMRITVMFDQKLQRNGTNPNPRQKLA